MKWFWNNYLPDESKRKEPTVSPLQATIDQLKGLPPALLIVGEFDPLHSEVEAYAHKLIDAGVQVTAMRMLGTTHDFAMLNPIASTPPTRAAITIANSYIKKALE
jgi:acetyl esterase